MTTNKLSALLLMLILYLFSSIAQAQPFQQLRGTVADLQMKNPLPGATVVLDNGKAFTTTDTMGVFQFRNVPVGIHQLTISYTGYAERVWENLALSAGKELVLQLSMEPLLEEEKQVVVTATSRKNRPLNDMSIVSARAFTVEETQRYAASINDPLRMATAYAGVVSADDGGNEIVIRGNAPTGLIWRMEGVDIPNPNHFADAGSSGGGISILSTQLLSNSDFITGAFAAEYGNGLSGVFDLKLRKGNNQQAEYSAQAGVLGLNLGAEGPFRKGKGSYLANYRYSTLQLLSKIGVDVGGGATNFQDFSYHVNLPAGKSGSISLFGFGGLSESKFRAEKDPAKWESEWDRYSSVYKSNTGVTGLKHEALFGKNTRLESNLAYSITNNASDYDYLEDNESRSLQHRDHYLNRKLAISSTIQHRVSPEHLFRAGLRFQRLSYAFSQDTRENPEAALENVINADGGTGLLQAHAQWQFRPSRKISLVSGFHFIQLLLNNTWNIEPRAALLFQARPRTSFSVGYGLHSQAQPLGIYYVKQDEKLVNKTLDLSKSHHIVLGWQELFGKNWKAKAEIYYQYLFDIPVSIYDTSSFSMLNIRGDYVAEPLRNEGKGKNYGLELSLEKHLTRGFYGMVSTSFFQSEYTAANGKAYNTRFNGKRASSLVAGKEWSVGGSRRIWGANIRLLQSGGYWNTPVNVPLSQQLGYAVFHEARAFSIQNPDYFRLDIRVSHQWNYAGLSATLSLDIQNATNRNNVFTQAYDREKAALETVYQMGIAPVLNYKIEF